MAGRSLRESHPRQNKRNNQPPKRKRRRKYTLEEKRHQSKRTLTLSIRWALPFTGLCIIRFRFQPPPLRWNLAAFHSITARVHLNRSPGPLRSSSGGGSGSDRGGSSESSSGGRGERREEGGGNRSDARDNVINVDNNGPACIRARAPAFARCLCLLPRAPQNDREK